MQKDLIIDTSFTVGVSPKTQFIAEEEMADYLDESSVDLQYIYQPDECFCHHTPSWNPYLGNDYIAKIQNLYRDKVRGLATVQVWHQKNKCTCMAESCPHGIDHSRDIAKEELKRSILELGLWGLRINPAQHNNPLNNREICWPLLRQLSELQKECKRTLVVLVNGYGDHMFNMPEKLADAAKEFPELLFILQHGEFVWGGSALENAAALDNVLIDITTMPQYGIVSKIYETYGIEKFCIGIDGPLGDARIKEAIAEDICRSDYDRRMLLGGNLARRLGIR